MNSLLFKISIAVFVLKIWFGEPVTAAERDAPRPNIVYIMADDLGWKDVGFRGSDIKTPNIDRLAQEGARLEQFYAQPVHAITSRTDDRPLSLSLRPANCGDSLGR